jgi:hypothetical protein
MTMYCDACEDDRVFSLKVLEQTVRHEQVSAPVLAHLRTRQAAG